MAANVICRTVQAVLVVVAALVVADSMLPGHTVSGLSHVVGFLAGSALGLLALGLEEVRTQWATRQRREAGYRQRHGMS